MNPLVSVIVVNHNRAQLLETCLDSLVSQNWRPLEILVIDNASRDDSLAVVKKFHPSLVRSYPQTRNLGFAAGNNVGIRAAQGQFIALLNNDAIVAPQWLENLMEAVESSPQIGMCASKILLFQGKLIDKAGHLMYLDGQNRGRGTGALDCGQYSHREEVFFPDGCAALYRREVLESTGGFDETFFAYGDDADLGVRARWLGWKCLYVPEAVVYHHQSSTSGLYSIRKVYWVERNRLWLAVKNFPLPLLILNPLLTAYRWLWNLCAALLGRGAAGNFRRNTSWGVMLSTLGRAYWHSLRGFPEMWRKRRHIRARRRISTLEFCRLLLRFRISARELAFNDPPRQKAVRGGS